MVSNSTTPTVLLFDIDGTLLSAGGAGKRAIEHAVSATVGRTYQLDFGLDGMTDRAIVRQALVALGRGTADTDLQAAIDTILDAYVASLAVELAQTNNCRVYPGVEAVLAAARAEGATVALGLGTGNIQRGAALKLGRVHLDHYFSFGGFGCDHEQRPAILQAGARRGAAMLNLSLSSCRLVVIGDTPRDIAAAHAVGAESIGVATGNFSCEALCAAGATYTFADLTAHGAQRALFGG